jgi:hypothetical protein
MLENAKKYEQELVKLHHEIAYDPFYFFQQRSVYRETFKLPEDTWNSHHFVSIVNGKIIGYISYGVRRTENAVEGLNIVHFGGKNAKGWVVFGRDVMTALKDVFEKFRFEEIIFLVIIGNPIEKTYDKLIMRYGGRIIGTYKNDTRTMDGVLRDLKTYEITADEYFNSKGYLSVQKKL